jgi:hypothetical protein
MGPFLTTGVALVAATVVVANPLAPPSRDMQISTTQLSGSPGLLSPSDKSLLSALTPQFQPTDIGPALAQILAALAADADRISREVNSGVGIDAPVAAAAPELTAYRPEPLASTLVASTNAASPMSFSSAVVSSQVQKVLNGLVFDTSYLGGKVVEAAYAAVDVIIRVPEFLVIAMQYLLNGDVAGALNTVKSAVRAFFGSGLIILDGIRDVLFGPQAPPAAPPTAAKSVVTQTSSADTGQSTAGGTVGPTRDGKATSARKHDVTPSAASPRPTATTTKSAASSNDTTTTTTSATAHSISKPAGSTRSTAGSARGVTSAD